MNAKLRKASRLHVLLHLEIIQIVIHNETHSNSPIAIHSEMRQAFFSGNFVIKTASLVFYSYSYF